MQLTPKLILWQLVRTLMRTGALLWRENAQRKLSPLKGFLNARTVVRGFCYNIAPKWISKWHRSVLTDSDCSVICLLCVSGSGHTHFPEWGSWSGRWPKRDSSTATQQEELHCACATIAWITEGHSRVRPHCLECMRYPFLKWGRAPGSWCVCSTSCIIWSYLLLGFFVWLGFFSCHTCTHVKVRQLVGLSESWGSSNIVP